MSFTIDRLEDIYLDGMIDKDKYRTSYQRISREISELSLQIKHKPQISPVLQQIKNDTDFRNTYEKLTRENKQRFWKSIISSITFPNTPDTRGQGAYIPFVVEFL